ncbi:MAG: hypothetical protein P8Q99_08685 [Paracoccaceae bacterium]|nr:hypothetical protein [Paracoccaceae bacterium]
MLRCTIEQIGQSLKKGVIVLHRYSVAKQDGFLWSINTGKIAGESKKTG